MREHLPPRTLIDRLLTWLASHGRLTVIPDRDGQRPYLERYYLLLRERPDWFPCNLFLHHIRASDVEELHDHPWPWASLVLRGGYWEYTPTGKHWRRPFSFLARSATSLHRIELDPERAGGPTWTLFLVGPRVREWGFVANGRWVPWRDFLTRYRKV